MKPESWVSNHMEGFGSLRAGVDWREERIVLPPGMFLHTTVALENPDRGLENGLENNLDSF